MKAIVITNISGKDVLQEQEVSVPKLNDDEVLIKVVAIAVNEPDIIEMEMFRNSVQPRKAFGLECSGIIEKVGSQVKTLKVHDEVCAILSGEGYAEKVCVPQGHVLPKPNNIPLVFAATLPYASCIIWTELFTKSKLSKYFWLPPNGKARLSSDETLLVHEDCSGIDIFAIQIAKRMGATVYVSVSSRKENNRYKNCNADFVVDFDDYNNLVREATGEEKGVDVVLQSRVSTHFEKNLSCLKTGGRLISLGTCSLDTRDGFDTFPDTIQPDIPKIYWLSAASFWRRNQESKARIVAEVKEYVWPLIEAGIVCPVFPCRLFPFSEANEAYKLMKSEMTSHNNIGKILLVPNSS
ncbi:hypothetical protein OROMI_017873 [Orobanche minor]